MLAGNKLLTIQPLINPARIHRLSHHCPSAWHMLLSLMQRLPCSRGKFLLSYPSRPSTKPPPLEVPFFWVCSGSPPPPCRSSAPTPCTPSGRLFYGTKDTLQDKQLLSRTRMRGEIPWNSVSLPVRCREKLEGENLELTGK